MRRTEGGGSRRECSPVRRKGARAGHQPGVEPHRRMATGVRSTVVGASGGAAAASRGVVTSTCAPPSAMVAASSSIAAEATDGLHPAMETSESTHSMAATGDEAVAATILVDEAKEKGDKAGHLTDGKESAIYTKGETRRSEGMRRFQPEGMRRRLREQSFCRYKQGECRAFGTGGTQARLLEAQDTTRGLGPVWPAARLRKRGLHEGPRLARYLSRGVSASLMRTPLRGHFPGLPHGGFARRIGQRWFNGAVQPRPVMRAARALPSSVRSHGAGFTRKTFPFGAKGAGPARRFPKQPPKVSHLV